MQKVIGVIDLLDGKAVHAVAGNRDQYQSVAFCDGNAKKLASHYRDLGTRGLYVADLDAITTGKLQIEVIHGLCDLSADVDVLIDVGWTGIEESETITAVQDLATLFPNTFWIIATESARSSHEIASLGDHIDPKRIVLGLDLHNGNLVTADRDPKQTAECWLDDAREAGCTRALVLDLAGVGVSEGPKTLDVCQEIHRSYPEFILYSGAGVRDGADVQAFIDAGCDRCLVATALYR